MKIEEYLKSLPNNIISGEDVHISFDVDCLDPSVMPCTGTKYQNGITVNTAKLLIFLPVSADVLGGFNVFVIYSTVLYFLT